MSMTRHVILNYVDTPLKILLWTVDEILMLIGPAFLGLIIDQFILGMLISVVYFWGYKRYQRKFGKGQFQAVRYWYLPTSRSFKWLPPSYVQEYLG